VLSVSFLLPFGARFQPPGGSDSEEIGRTAAGDSVHTAKLHWAWWSGLTVTMGLTIRHSMAYVEKKKYILYIQYMDIMNVIIHTYINNYMGLGIVMSLEVKKMLTGPSIPDLTWSISWRILQGPVSRWISCRRVGLSRNWRHMLGLCPRNFRDLSPKLWVVFRWFRCF